MSFLGKTKATGYGTLGLATATIGGLAAASGSSKFGYNEIETALDAGTQALDGVNSYLEGDDLSDVKDDLEDGWNDIQSDYGADTINNIGSGVKYGVIGLGLLGLGAYSFRSAGKNW